MITIHNALHPKSNIDHFNLPREADNIGLQGAKETVNLTNSGLESYEQEFRDRLITAVRFVDIDLIGPIRETTIEATKQKKEERTIS